MNHHLLTASVLAQGLRKAQQCPTGGLKPSRGLCCLVSLWSSAALKRAAFFNHHTTDGPEAGSAPLAVFPDGKNGSQRAVRGSTTESAGMIV